MKIIITILYFFILSRAQLASAQMSDLTRDILLTHGYSDLLQDELSIRPERYNELLLGCYESGRNQNNIRALTNTLERLLAIADANVPAHSAWPESCDMNTITEADRSLNLNNYSKVYIAYFQDYRQSLENRLAAQRFNTEYQQEMSVDDSYLENIINNIRGGPQRRHLTTGGGGQRENILTIIDRIQTEILQLRARGTLDEFVENFRLNNRNSRNLRSVNMIDGVAYAQWLNDLRERVSATDNEEALRIENILADLKILKAMTHFRVQYLALGLIDEHLNELDQENTRLFTRIECIQMRQRGYERIMRNNFTPVRNFDYPYIDSLLDDDVENEESRRSCNVTNGNYPRINFCRVNINGYDDWLEQQRYIKFQLIDELRTCVMEEMSMINATARISTPAPEVVAHNANPPSPEINDEGREPEPSHQVIETSAPLPLPSANPN